MTGCASPACMVSFRPSRRASLKAGSQVPQLPTAGLPDKSIPTTPSPCSSAAKFTVSKAAQLFSLLSMLSSNLTMIGISSGPAAAYLGRLEDARRSCSIDSTWDPHCIAGCSCGLTKWFNFRTIFPAIWILPVRARVECGMQVCKGFHGSKLGICARLTYRILVLF